MSVLEFEKPLVEIEKKIQELKKISAESGMDLDKEIETFEQQANDYKKELYTNLKPSQKLQIARHQERPNFLDYVNLICEDFEEMHGDRTGMDDRAIIGGLNELCLSVLKKVKLQKKTLSTILVCHNLKDIEKLLDFSITQTSLICQS